VSLSPLLGKRKSPKTLMPILSHRYVMCPVTLAVYCIWTDVISSDTAPKSGPSAQGLIEFCFSAGKRSCLGSVGFGENSCRNFVLRVRLDWNHRHDGGM